MDNQNSSYQSRRRENDDPSGFKTLFKIIIVLFALGWVLNLFGPRCRGCGERWNGYSNEYCFSCQAEQKKYDAYYR